MISSILVWWRWGGSNSRPLHCERSALPSELHPHKGSRRVGWRRFPAVFKRSSGYEGVSTQTRRRPGPTRSSGRRTKGPVFRLLDRLYHRLRCFRSVGLSRAGSLLCNKRLGLVRRLSNPPLEVSPWTLQSPGSSRTPPPSSRAYSSLPLASDQHSPVSQKR